jgi:thioredoxin-related protein
MNAVRQYLLLAGLLFMIAGAEANRDPGQYFFDQSLGDFQEELQMARDEGKAGVLIFFEMEECPFCHRMKTTVLNQPEVQDYYKEHFLIYPVDIEGDVEIVDFEGETRTQKDFAFRGHRVRATPVFGFFDLEGKLVTRYTGATKDAAEFLLLGEYVVNGIYEQMSFARYKRQQADAR